MIIPGSACNTLTPKILRGNGDIELIMKMSSIWRYKVSRNRKGKMVNTLSLASLWLRNESLPESRTLLCEAERQELGLER